MEKAQIDIAHMSVASWGGEFYFQVVIEEHTRKFALSFFKLKSQSLPEWAIIHKRWLTEKPHAPLQQLVGGGE